MIHRGKTVIKGERLTKLREFNGMSKKALADYLGFNQNTIADWEREIHKPSYSSIVVMAELFHVTIEMITGSEELILEGLQKVDLIKMQMKIQYNRDQRAFINKLVYSPNLEESAQQRMEPAILDAQQIHDQVLFRRRESNARVIHQLISERKEDRKWE